MDNHLISYGVAEPAEQSAFVERNFWRKIRRIARHVPLAETAIAAFFAATDRATPAHVKSVLFAALAYFIIPFDAIPDVLLGLGFTDDLAVLLTAMKALAPHVGETHRARAMNYLLGEQREHSRERT